MFCFKKHYECCVCLENKTKIYNCKLCKNTVVCSDCIESMSEEFIFDKCPICRQKFSLEVNHNYNTRINYHIQNKERIINQMKEYLNDYIWLTMEQEEKIIQFDKIFQYIYDNKSLLKYEKFKKVVLDKIDYLKNEGEFIGFYWSQKIY